MKINKFCAFAWQFATASGLQSDGPWSRAERTWERAGKEQETVVEFSSPIFEFPSPIGIARKYVPPDPPDTGTFILEINLQYGNRIFFGNQF